MGSGSALVAAVQAGRRAWGCDICEEAIGIADHRLRAIGAIPSATSANALAPASMPMPFGLVPSVRP